MLTLSFARQYYTLWEITSSVEYGRGETINGVFTGEVYNRINYYYIQNLSFEEAKAIEKITAMSGENGWERNDSLIGKSRSFSERKPVEQTFAPWQFTFGKLTACDIRTSEDVWQLRRAMHKEPSARTKVYARRRLIELGELVRYTWTDRIFEQTLCDKWWREESQKYEDPYSVATHDMFCVDKKRNYTTTKHAAMLEQKKTEESLSGHFGEDGKRVELSLKRVGGFSFEGSYGTTFIEKYLTASGKMVKYKGGTPPDISETEFTKVKATIKHDEYKGVKETKLQRIKVLNLI